MDSLDRLKKEVFARRKILNKIYFKFGSKTVFDYVSTWQMPPSGKTNLAFNRQFISQASQIYPQDSAKEALSQLSNQPLISSIDHYGILNHPFFINSNLIFSLRQDIKYLICLPTAGVSLNNSSWPGCLVLTDNIGRQVRLSFFHDRHKTKTVFAAEKITSKEVNNVLEQITRLSFLNNGQKVRLKEIVEKIFLSARILGKNNFSSQACLISSMLWQEVFPAAPKMIYLPLEDLVGQIIIKEIALNPSHILHKLFFTKEGWLLVEKYFMGLKGAFGNGWGSFLFWGVDENAKRISFFKNESTIYDQQSGTGYRLQPEPISEAILGRKLYPTSLVCFLVTLYYNLNCLGGFNQTGWLTEIKEKLIALLAEMGEKDLSVQVSNAITDSFAETTLAFSFVGDSLVRPSLLDLYLNNVNYQTLREMAKKITLAQSLETQLPEIYRIVVPEKDRLVNLAAITPTQIAEKNGLTKALGLL